MPLNGSTVAAIDIGTNSVLLLVAKKTDKDNFDVLADEAEVTRLGEGLSANGFLKDSAMERTIAVLKRYIDIAKQHNYEKVVAVGTEALRRASNARSFVDRVKDECGIDIDIISGEREAELTFEPSARDFGRDITLIDIGGGSTEFIAGGKKISVRIGAVTMLERFLHGDPVTEKEFNELAKACAETIARDTKNIIQLTDTERPLVGVAGTCSTLAAMHLGLEKYSHSEVHGLKMTIGDIDSIISRLTPLTIQERREIKGLHPDRADVILPGAVILREAMKLLKKCDVIISDRGIRFGIVYSLFA